MTICRIVGVILLLLLIFGGCGDEKNKVCSVDWSKEPTWSLDTIAIAQEVDITGIWGMTQSNVYAVGRIDSGHGSIGMVWKYNGTSWSKFHSRPNADFRDIHGISSSSIWVAGIDGPDSYPGDAVVIHWNGAEWEESLVEQSIGGLLAIWAADDNEVYAIDRSRGAIVRYDGTAWDEEETPVQEDPPFTLSDHADIWGTCDGGGPTVYAGLAMGNVYGVVVRKSEDHWSLDFPEYDPEPGSIVVGVWAADSGTAFALEQVSRGRLIPDGIVYQRVNAGWVSSPTLVASALFSGLRSDGNGSVFVYGQQLYRIQGPTSTRYEGFPSIFIEDLWIHRPGIIAVGHYGSDVGVALFGDFSTGQSR